MKMQLITTEDDPGKVASENHSTGFSLVSTGNLQIISLIATFGHVCYPLGMFRYSRRQDLVARMPRRP